MAWPWLKVAAKTIPWAALIQRAPEIIEFSKRLVNRKADPAKRGPTQMHPQADELRERLRNLEARDQENAKVMEQMAQQLQDLTNSVEVLSARMRVLVAVVAIILVAVGGISLVLAINR